MSTEGIEVIQEKENERKELAASVEDNIEEFGDDEIDSTQGVNKYVEPQQKHHSGKTATSGERPAEPGASGFQTWHAPQTSQTPRGQGDGNCIVKKNRLEDSVRARLLQQLMQRKRLQATSLLSSEPQRHTNNGTVKKNRMADSVRAQLLQRLIQRQRLQATSLLSSETQNQQWQSQQTGTTAHLLLQQQSKQVTRAFAQQAKTQKLKDQPHHEEDLFDLAISSSQSFDVNANEPSEVVSVRTVHARQKGMHLNEKLVLLIQKVCEPREMEISTYNVKRKNAAEKVALQDIRAIDETAPVNVHLWRHKAAEFKNQWSQVMHRPGSKFVEIHRFSTRTTKETHLTQWLEVDTIDDGKMKGTVLRVFVDASVRLRLLTPAPPLAMQEFQSLFEQEAPCRVSLVGVLCNVGEMIPTSLGDVKAAFDVRDAQGRQVSGYALGGFAAFIQKLQQVEVAFFNMAARRSLKNGKTKLWAFHDSYVLPLRRVAVLPEKNEEIC